ncbi:hypothetical protein KSP40_PGU021052 [Platanthera guangdongensis]|uniref:Uncharacterized protein n=1 Tax=Platanthera guangdongensis TaxID=2320717 RepID=A0ABR2M0D8_9ASPA
MNGGNGGSALEALTSTSASAGLVQNVAVLAPPGTPLTSWESLDVCDGDAVNVAPGIAPRVMDGSMPGGALVSGAMHCGGGVPRVFGGSPPPTVAGPSLGTVGVNDVMGVRCNFTGGVSGAIFPTPLLVDSGVALAADMEDEPGLDDVELDAMEEAFDPLAGGVDSTRMDSSVSRSVGGNIECNVVPRFGALPDAIAGKRGIEDGHQLGTAFAEPDREILRRETAVGRTGAVKPSKANRFGVLDQLEDGPLREMDVGTDTEPTTVESAPPDVPGVVMVHSIDSGNVQLGALAPVVERSDQSFKDECMHQNIFTEAKINHSS